VLLDAYNRLKRENEDLKKRIEDEKKRENEVENEKRGKEDI